MLDPHKRRLYSDALQPPPGYTFDYGLATTFTLDLTTLLTIPLHLTLFSGGRDTEELLEDAVGLLESLRRTTERLEVYCQQGMIHVPKGTFALYSMLEPVVREVRPPVHGIFHPKVWALRFVGESDGHAHLRLLVLTRNLAQDRSWDMSLRLEGEIGDEPREENAPLARLLESLPGMSSTGPRQASAAHVGLVDELRRTTWDPPDPFREVRFHVFGIDGGTWVPPTCDEALVISPFVSDRAIETITGRATRNVALVSRMEELANLYPPTLEPFDQVLHLHPDTGAEDPEASNELLEVMTGLHAKAYALKRGWDTHLFVGSANATTAGMEGANVEILAELVGRWSQVGRPSTLLDDSGFIEILDSYEAPEEIPESSEEEKAAEAGLNATRKALIDADLRVRCREDEGQWKMVLEPSRELRWGALKDVRVWPITLRSESAAQAVPREWHPGESIEFACALSSITAFFAFHLVAEQAGIELRFVLSLPIEGIPEEREGAIFRSVLADRERFVRYLLLLLGTFDDPWAAQKFALASSRDGRFGTDDIPLLEEMVRALCRDPARLVMVKRVVERLLEDPDSDEVIPPRFVDLWNVIESEVEMNART